MEDTPISPSQFVALINQTLEFAYPVVVVEGEVANFRISKNRWVYFDLKDDSSVVKFFGTVYQLNTPIEDGMMVRVAGNPKLHHLYGFSVTVQSLEPAGEGSIKRAFELLKQKLSEEGLFEQSRKRTLPDFPQRVGLITSAQAAAYNDFFKILNARWSGLEVLHADVQVQGESAPAQLVRAIEYFNQLPEPVNVIVLTRGGGSAEDLMAFSSEEVARAVAGSRTPTIVGVGHEDDISLADLAADVRAATPSNAAQLLVPDRKEIASQLNYWQQNMFEYVQTFSLRTKHKLSEQLTHLAHQLQLPAQKVGELRNDLVHGMTNQTNRVDMHVSSLSRTLRSTNPKKLLSQGYAIARNDRGKIIKSAATLKRKDKVVLELSKGKATTEVVDVKNN